MTKNQRDQDTMGCTGDKNWHSDQGKCGAKEENQDGGYKRLIVYFVCGEGGRVINSEPDEHISSLLSVLLRFSTESLIYRVKARRERWPADQDSATCCNIGCQPPQPEKFNIAYKLIILPVGELSA